LNAEGMPKDLNASGLERAFPWRHALIPLIWALLILGLHAIPGSDLHLRDWTVVFHVDKLIHACMFGVLSLSVFVALGKAGTIRKYKAFAILGLALYGVLLELAQGLWFIQRDASVLDMVADFAGVLLGRVAFRLVYRCWN
jgi:VanZ family protein